MGRDAAGTGLSIPAGILDRAVSGKGDYNAQERPTVPFQNGSEQK
jgi:hypothetical protein